MMKANSNPKNRNIRVLCIEDDPVQRSFVKDVLEDDSIPFAGVTSGEEGLNLCDTEDFDTVILDLALPGISGLDVLREMKQRVPDREIIIISGTESPSDLVECINEGAFRYFPKPINHVDLIAAVKTAVEIYHLRKTERRQKLELEALVKTRTHQWEESRDRFYALYNSQNLVFITDEFGRFTDINNAVTDTLGFSNEDLLGKCFTDLLYSDIQKEKLTDKNVDIKLRRQDGRAIYLRLEAAEYKGAKEYIYVGKDTTETVESYQRLEQSKQLLQALNNRLVTLIHSTTKISKTNRLDKIGKTFLEVFSANMESEGGSIYHVDDNGMVLLHSIGDQKPVQYLEFPLRENSIFSLVVKQKSPILVKDINQANSIQKSGGSYKNNSVLVFPILNDDQDIITVVSLHNKKAPPFTEQDQKIGQILAAYTYESIRSATISGKLKESEEMYRVLVENANEGILVVQDKQLVFRNPKASELITANSWADDNNALDEILTPEDLVLVESAFEEMRQAGKIQHRSEFKLKKKAGGHIWLETNSVVIDWDNQPAFLIFLSDITERKNAEQLLQNSHDLLEKKVGERTTEINKTNEQLEIEIFIRKQAAKRLRESEERFRSLVEISSDWIWELSAEGKFTYASPVVTELLGYRPDEVLGKSPVDVLRPNLESSLNSKNFQQAFQKTLGNHRPIRFLEHQVLHKNGNFITLETSAVPRFDEEGEFLGYRGIDRNITERKRIEEERLRLIEILEVTTDLVLISNLEHRTLYMNKAAKAVLGIDKSISVEEIELRQFFPKTSFEITLREGIPTAEKRGTWSAESYIKDKENHEIPVSQVLMAHRGSDGEIAYYSQIIRDMTHQKKVEFELITARKQAETANQAKSDFLSNISHELRTPLHHVLSYAKFGTTKEQLDGAKTKEYFEKIYTSGRNLLGLLNALLDLSRMEAGKAEYCMTLQNLHTIAWESVDELRMESQKKNITINLAKPETKVLVYCDGIKIKEVIRNILTNAIKFSSSGDTVSFSMEAVMIQAGRRATDTETIQAVQVKIEDEGVGIPEDELEAVFDKFVQSSKTRTGTGGTGLGLSIAKEVIKAHNGAIWAERAQSGGAIFKFYIPKRQPLLKVGV